MKSNMMLALAATLMCAPLAETYAADAAKDDKATEKSDKTAEKPKPKKKVNKKPFYAKAEEALKTADLAQCPIIAFYIPATHPLAVPFKRKIVQRKEFQDLAKKNFVLYWPKFDKDPKNAKKLAVKTIKAADKELFEKFAVDPKQVELAKASAMPEPTWEDYSVYPAVVILKPDAQEVLLRMPKFDEDGGFGVWILELTDRLRDGGVELEITPAIKKILANPMEEANKAQSKGGGKKKK